jgi:site-specific DNA recombinase
LLLTYEHMVQSASEVKTISKQRLGEFQSKLKKLEERFAYGEIDRNIFEKIGYKLKDEIRSLEAGFAEPKNKVSNPEKVIARAVEICSSLSGLWISGGNDQKVQL